MIKTFETYYAHYEVSFDIKPYDLVPRYSNILHLTTGNTSSEIPAAFFFANSSTLIICSEVSGGLNCYFGAEDLSTERYTHVTIKQSRTQNQIYFFTITINGKEVYRVQNTQPTTYTNVKVYRSNPWNPPAKAFIINLLRGNISPILPLRRF